MILVPWDQPVGPTPGPDPRAPGPISYNGGLVGEVCEVFSLSITALTPTAAGPTPLPRKSRSVRSPNQTPSPTPGTLSDAI